MPPPNREQSFRSKIDTWIVIVIAAAFLAGPVMIIADHLADGTSLEIGLVVTIVAILVPGLFVVWLFRSTDYTITASDLMVRSGPFRWNVPLTDIHGIRPTRSFLSAPALSLDRIEVLYGKYGSVIISPEDRRGFLLELRERLPSMIVSGIEP